MNNKIHLTSLQPTNQMPHVVANQEEADPLNVQNYNLESETNIYCNTCRKLTNSNKIVMLKENEVWKISINEICQFGEKAIVQIRDFRPNLMHLGNNYSSLRFTKILSKLIVSLAYQKAPLQHQAAALIQVFPAIIIQCVGTNNVDNREACDRRLDQWTNGDLWTILTEAEAMQNKIKKEHKPDKNKIPPKNKKSACL